MTDMICFAEFNGDPIEIIDRNGQPWITAEQVGVALGIKHPAKAVNKIYQRHSDEFTAGMVGHTKLTTPGGIQETRIFSARGAWLIAMFCQTDRAKEFRRWVLDVLEAETRAPAMPSLAQHLEAEIHRLRAERDAARAVAIASRPAWAKLARYLRMDLSRAEIALLMGWRSTSSVRRQVAKLESLGLIEQRQQSLDLDVRS